MSKSLLENKIFHDATKARAWLEALLWADGRVCGYCGTVDDSTELPARPGFYQCNSKECRKQFTVMVGTVFERSHIPLNKWLCAAFLLSASKKGISAHQMHRMLGITYKSAWFMMHRLREATTRLSRHGASQQIGLVDSDGNYFSFCDPAPLKATLRELDMNAGGALGADDTALSTGEGKTYLARSLAEEPFASSFIEGAATTRQIAKKLIFEGRRPRTKDERMVLNNYRAMQFIKARKDDPLTIPMLLELHKIVTEETMDNR
jgi:hypothetical protein